MSKFKRVLSDKYIDDVVLSSPITIGKSLNRSKDFILMIEQAVLAKLAEQEPVAYAAIANNGNIRIWSITQQKAVEAMTRDGIELKPLYAHPIQNNNLTDGTDTDGGSNITKLSLSVDTKEVQALLQSFLDGLDGWQLVPKEPSRDMLKKMFYEMFGMDGIEEECLAARYRNMLSSFPKYTGVIND